MAVTRFREGSVTVTLSGELEAFVRQALDAAAGATVRAMEREAEIVAQEARRDWYGSDGVNRRTGRTGDVQVVTTVSAQEIRVSVGSTDPGAIYVHRPGPLSTVAVEVDEAAYHRGKKGTKAALYFHARSDQPGRGVRSGRYYRLDPNPARGDGKYLVPQMIRGPMQARIKTIAAEVGTDIASRLKR